MSDQEEIATGLIGDGWKETDYQLLGGVLVLPFPRNTYKDAKIEYHQPDIAPNCCTVHGAMGAVSDLTKYTFTPDQREAIWSEALRRGANESIGWYISPAVDLVRQKFKEFTGIDLKSFTLALDADETMDVLEKGYTLVVGYRGNAAYNADKNDGVLLGTQFIPTTYGHCLRMINENELEVRNLDNYSKGSHNSYRFTKENLKRLVQSGNFFRMSYVFAYAEDIETMNAMKNVPEWGLKSWAKALKKGLNKAGDDPMAIIGDEEDENALFVVGGLTKREGNLTRVRRAVAYDRLHLLD